ncbi:putative short chain dehydrogenase/reductase [Talaromyces proteolyticus]|uniref:Short chain dehydrogenase/reductase n=1 Tax=Talaromyces proteolyticus TaxID=1131652 RepID=A0AAD4KQ89_9EURO|nr:putative short chain dehydrogenase/reductase [Talaromyces proteolyticus]KAH8697868.1 putative short chain dehydrogenase/reductase [Talaromyces proteolyticus]
MANLKRTFLITGANSGVGYATAHTIAAKSPDYHVILASRSITNGQEALDEIKTSSSLPIKGTLSLVQLDVTNEESIASAVKLVESEFGYLDVLINNAATTSGGTKPYTREGLRNLFDTNVLGPMLMLQAFQPLLEKSIYRDGAYVIQVSSGLGAFAQADNPKNPNYPHPFDAYRMSKAALNMMTVQAQKSLGREKGFKIFSVCPGLVRSNLRGKSEEQRNAGGLAGNPLVSGRVILGVLEGERDDAVGKFVHEDGVYKW